MACICRSEFINQNTLRLGRTVTMLKMLDFKQYWDKKLVAWNKELIEEVSKELYRKVYRNFF